MGFSLKIAGGARRILAIAIASSLALAYLPGDTSSVVAAESNIDLSPPVEKVNYAKKADQKYLVIESFADAGQALLGADTRIKDAFHLSGKGDLHQSVCFVKTRAPGLRWRAIIRADKFSDIGLDGARFLGQLGFKVFALDIRAGIVKCDRGLVVDPAAAVGTYPAIKTASHQQKSGAYGVVKRGKKSPEKSSAPSLPNGVLGAPVYFDPMDGKGELSKGKSAAGSGGQLVGVVAAEAFVSEALAVSGRGASAVHPAPRSRADLGAGGAVSSGAPVGVDDRRNAKNTGGTDARLVMDVGLPVRPTSLRFEEPLPSGGDARPGVVLWHESEARKDDGFRPARWQLSDSQSAFTAGEHPSAFAASGESESGGICRQIVSVPSERLVPTYSADYLYMTPDGTQCALMYVVNLNEGSSL